MLHGYVSIRVWVRIRQWLNCLTWGGGGLKFWWPFFAHSLFEVPLCPVQQILMTFFCSTHFLKYPFPLSGIGDFGDLFLTPLTFWSAPLSGAGDFDDLFLLNSLFEVPFVQDRRFWWSFFLKLTFWSTLSNSLSEYRYSLSVTSDFYDLFLFFLNSLFELCLWPEILTTFFFFLNSLIELCPWPEILTTWASAAFSVKSRLLPRAKN